MTHRTISHNSCRRKPVTRAELDVLAEQLIGDAALNFLKAAEEAGFSRDDGWSCAQANLIWAAVQFAIPIGYSRDDFVEDAALHYDRLARAECKANVRH
jgi:hypothetical protein